MFIGYIDGVIEVKCFEGKLFIDKRLKELVEKLVNFVLELMSCIKEKLFDYIVDVV